MGFKLFKSGDDLYSEGEEYLKRGEYSKARSILQKSIDKDGGVDDVAAVKVALIDLSTRLTNAGAYGAVLNALKNMTSADSFEFGLVHVDRERLMKECELTMKKLTILTSGTGSEQAMERGQQLQELAIRYQTEIGETSMLVLEIFKNDTTVTGFTEFYNLMALSYELMADGTVWDDPSQAAEYQQIAMGYRQQNGQSGEENADKIRKYSNSCKCWLCGRMATGEGIHFYSADADVSPSLNKDDGGLRSSPGDQEHIYICRACYSAVSKRANAISLRYYEKCMAEMQAMEARLQAEISSLQSQISFLRASR